MEKAILVIEIPKKCYDCPCFEGEMGWCKADKEERDVPSFDKLPEWCPLKPIPKKKEITESMVLNQHYQNLVNYHSGWNACLDEILGGIEYE